MKKVVSIILVVIMLFAMAVPAFAWVDANGTKSQIPVIRISGDGEPLYNAEGEKIFHFRDIANMGGDEEDGNAELYSSIANVLLPFMIEGVLYDEWDNYYANLQKEISELFGDAVLDNNGNPVNGTGLAQYRLDELEYNKNNDKKGDKGYYSIDDYWFRYDWRLDPLATADDFNDYIKAIKETTGCEKVSIVSSCLGTSIVTAYVAKYGMDDIHGIGFDGAVNNGAEILSETISGKFKLNPDAITRVLEDSVSLGWFELDSFVIASLDLLSKSGVIDAFTEVTKEYIYYKVVEGVTSALALSTFFTWPSYWAAVSAEDYDTALKYVFGAEDSEKRTEYAGLIEKIENYDKVVRQNFDDIMLSIKESGANIGVIAKYGFQMIPICESADEIADQFVSVEKASYGATTSDIYTTLSAEYIEQRVSEGFGKYISADKQVDASTCMFPDYTWFTKGVTHSNWTSYEMKILYDVVTADTQLTVDDFPYTQFMVYDNETGIMSPMTEENCNTEIWHANEKEDNPQTAFEKLIALIRSAIKWIRELFGFLSEKAAENATTEPVSITEAVA